MPFFLLTLPDSALAGVKFGKQALIAAETANDAKAMAKAAFDGDASAAWDAAVVTTLAEVLANAANAMTGWKFRVAVLDSTPVVDIEATGVLGAVSATIGAGGTGYATNDIVTVSGGTNTRAATFRVTGETGGVVDSVEVVDPGDYTAMPSNPASTTGGTGSGLTLTITSDNDRMANLAAHAVTLLNATTPIAGAAIDMGATPPLLTIASGGGGDDLGDKTVSVEVKPPGVAGVDAVAGFLGTLTHQGVTTAVLSVQIIDPATVTVPSIIATFE